VRNISGVTDNLQTLTLPDGRTLAYAEWGDPAGSPVMVLHGTPGCRLNRHPDNAKVAATGARVVTYDRPGYGASDRHHGRAVVDCVADITALVDHLGFDKFAVTGGSGGGPHSLAVAAGLPDRVTRAACIVGVAPYDVLGEDWFDGMDPANVREFGWALESEERVTAETVRESAAMIARMTEDPANMLGDFEIPAEDRAILSRPDVAAVMAEALPECVRNGVSGWVDDDIAFTNPWGFDLATIRVPTAVWWGSKDVLTPPGHGEWLAKNVPHAIIRVDHGAGHMGDPDANLQRLFPWLTDGTPWAD
jgi:pimeloyl-ACP methyl ester carboxylesterase